MMFAVACGDGAVPCAEADAGLDLGVGRKPGRAGDGKGVLAVEMAPAAGNGEALVARHEGRLHGDRHGHAFGGLGDVAVHALQPGEGRAAIGGQIAGAV
jgi:hypothetical protein